MKVIKIIISLIFAFTLLTHVKNVEAASVAKVVFSPVGQVVAGKSIRVDVFIDSNVAVNAVQLAITYPSTEITVSSVDTATSRFTIKAEETLMPGVIKIARGNVQALKGKNLLASLNVIPKTTTSLSQFSYDKNDSLVMSKDNVNVLSGSQVLTIKPITPTPTKNPKGGFTSILSKAVEEFFKGVFGR